MSDIVERLRATLVPELYVEAADEIERLRAVLREIAPSRQHTGRKVMRNKRAVEAESAKTKPRRSGGGARKQQIRAGPSSHGY